ncbi:ribonuclease Y [Candidatus Daviesbacteria bacterium]|nr:ribonuclease Y [Candidatus Daviesbacteria bacterium]
MKRTFGSPNQPYQSSSSEPRADVSSETEHFDELSARLAKREGILEERERLIAEKLKSVDEKLESLEKIRKDLVTKLEKSAEMDAEEAKKILLENVEKDLASDISKKIKEAEDEIKFTVDEKAKRVLAESMYHGVTDYISEYTTSTIKLPDEEMKGRIIGKEGRNIKAFEQSTGVDVVMDDELPDTLILSSFDPVRREIAKVSLERLMADGRIQPQRIEEIVEKTREDIEKIMYQAGEKLCYDAGVFNLQKEVIAMLGRFKYRFSFGQNLIQHSLELVKVGTAIARELGADVNIVRLGCLLHDIGKVVTDGDEGTHVEKGVIFARKHAIPEKVIDCIAQHHEDEPFSLVESIIVAIADGVSGGRPGARHENVQDYFKRLNDIERIATSFDGVDKAFAVQAGREVRVIVMPDRVSDDELPKLVRDIGVQIQKEVMVPGAVKITAVRETRAQESFLTSGS